MGRENLTVVANTLANKLIFDRTKVVGIEHEINKSKAVLKVLPRKELVLSGGAGNTPRVLLLSAVGAADHLKEIGGPLEPVTVYNASKSYPGNVLKIGYEWLRGSSDSTLKLRSASPRDHPPIDPKNEYIVEEESQVTLRFHGLEGLCISHARTRGGGSGLDFGQGTGCDCVRAQELGD
ncbi:hypothetical protein PRIC1_009641 [Phytophthora ramorum]|nr:Choline dehydrogenase, mitochondrial [Phytophthora ramorum]